MNEKVESATRSLADPEDLVETYFREFLPTLRGQLLLPDLRDFSTIFEIRVTGQQETVRRITVKQGRLTHIREEGVEARCVFYADSTIFLNVVTARESAQEAFFDARIEISGDIEHGLIISTVLGPFFEQFPFRP